MFERLNLKLANTLDLLDNAGLDITTLSIFWLLIPRIASDKHFAGCMLRACSLKGMNFTGGKVNKSKEKPNWKQDSQSDSGLLQIF